MDEDFQKFLHSQFSEAHDSQHSPEELSDLILSSKERYIEKSFLAEGGQKKIYRCHDSLTGRSIAFATLKENSSEEQTAKFIREARLTAHLEHPNIMPVYDTGSDNDSPFFTMKLISGESFEKYLSGTHSLTSKVDILIKVCDAVRFAHSKGIIHFDIKPDNIQVSKFGEVLLCDWGLAGIAYEDCSDELLNDELLKKVDLSQSLDTYFKGTAGYAAPEMWQKNTLRNKSADIYSLGAVLYKILGGQDPDIKPVLSYMKGPNALLSVCSKAISANPKDRYPTVDLFLKELISWRNGFATQAEDAGFITQVKLLILRHKNVSSSILASLCILSIIITVFIDSLAKKEKESSELAANLQSTENERLKLEEELKPKYLKNAYEAFLERNYQATIALCEHILRQGDSLKAKELIGMVHLSNQDFVKAKKYLEQNKRLLSFMDEYKDKLPLTVENLISFISQLDRSKRQTEMVLYKNLLLEAFESPLTISDKKKLMIAELKYKSPKTEDVNLQLEETPEGLIVDLSNNPGLNEIWVLQKLGNTYIKSLNLSNSPKNQLTEILKDLHIEKFILRNWPKRNIDFLKNRRILHLDVAFSKLDISDIIKNMPLVTLDIRQAPFKNKQALLELKFLRKLTISKDQIPQKTLLKLPQKVNVIIE